MIVASKLVHGDGWSGRPPIEVSLHVDWQTNRWSILCSVGSAIVLRREFGTASNASLDAWCDCDELVAEARTRHRQLSHEEGMSS